MSFKFQQDLDQGTWITCKLSSTPLAFAANAIEWKYPVTAATTYCAAILGKPLKV